MKNKSDPGEALTCNMYTDYKNYPNLEKLPDELEDSLDELNNNRDMREAFGEEVINSYIKLKNQEIQNFNSEETFDKKRSITEWEKKNTLDC